jgi:hypothetical protein
LSSTGVPGTSTPHGLAQLPQHDEEPALPVDRDATRRARAEAGTEDHHIGHGFGERFLAEAMPIASDRPGSLGARRVSVKRSDMMLVPI